MCRIPFYMGFEKKIGNHIDFRLEAVLKGFSIYCVLG